jgi:hypothetical protein
MRGVVDVVFPDKGFAFVVTHKGRVFMGLGPQLTVSKGSVVEFSVGQGEKVSTYRAMCDFGMCDFGGIFSRVLRRESAPFGLFSLNEPSHHYFEHLLDGNLHSNILLFLQ